MNNITRDEQVTKVTRELAAIRDQSAQDIAASIDRAISLINVIESYESSLAKSLQEMTMLFIELANKNDNEHYKNKHQYHFAIGLISKSRREGILQWKEKE